MASGGIARGVSAAVSATDSKKASDANFADTERYNREIELKFKKGKEKRILSNLAGKIPVFGAILKYGLQQLGLADCRTVMNGDCVCLGSGLYLCCSGEGLFLGPKGSDLF